MPETSQTILGALGYTLPGRGRNVVTELLGDQWDSAFTLTVIKPLFARPGIDTPAASSTGKPMQPSTPVEQTPVLSFDEWTKVELRVGTILTVSEVPKSDKLYH